MITLNDSTFNGWHAKDVKNGHGEVVCEKCGFKMDLPGGMESLYIKEHDCKSETRKSK